MADFFPKRIDRKEKYGYNKLRCRGIAQFGSALGSGPRVAGSNPAAPTTCGCSSMVERQPSSWLRGFDSLHPLHF